MSDDVIFGLLGALGNVSDGTRSFQFHIRGPDLSEATSVGIGGAVSVTHCSSGMCSDMPADFAVGAAE